MEDEKVSSEILALKKVILKILIPPCEKERSGYGISRKSY